MSVHYKFKSALDFDTITFDGLHISVSDLKKAIVHQKRLGKTTDFDLQITNAQTKEEYVENSTLIPKNTSLIIARIPIAVQTKKPWDPQAEKVQIQRNVSEPERGELDLSQMNGSEEEKIQVMILQSSIDYDPNKYHKLKGQGQTGEVPATYRCFKCHKPGHWIKNCPLNISGDFDHKRNTGIPKSFLQDRGGQQKIEEKFSQLPVAEKKQEIPEDLICSICKDLFTDAVMIPCCGSSFCDECVRTALLESEENECPDCLEKGSSPGSLIPNRFLRNSVNAFKNETGYNKIQKRKVTETVKPTESLPQTVVRSNGSQKNKTNVINEENTNTTEVTPIKEIVVQEKKIEAAYSSSHDENESDYEDNITVTVPPPLSHGQRSTLQEGYNSRNIKNPKPPGMENSPRQNLHSSPPEEMNMNNSVMQEITVTGSVDKMEHYSNHHISSNIPIQRGTTILVHRSTPNEIYGNAAPITSYPPQNMSGAVHGPPVIRNYHPHNYGVHNSGYSQYNMGDRMRGAYPVPRVGFHSAIPQIRPRYMVPSGNIESVYQGIAANVGSGIIDDPLEAFNRIMREKEKRKEERRRSPERRRSRSSDERSSRPRLLPRQHPKLHQRSPLDDRRENSPHMRDRRERSRNRDKRNFDMDKWKRGSSSFSDRSSRSRSWSNIPRRWSKSPINLRKRSRSRSPLFSPGRSPSRSISTSRFRDNRDNKLPSMRYDNSPFRSTSPRYRLKDTRKRRDDFKDCSPRGMRRLRRTPENQSNRQERFMGASQHHGKYDTSTEYNDRRFPRNSYKRYSRERQIDSKYNNQYNQEKNMNYKPLERYDDAPPGSEEPPPPGFEMTPHLECNTGNRNNFEDMDTHRNDYRKLNSDNKKNYRGNPHSHINQHRDFSGEYHEIPRHTKDGRQRDGRSWSQNSGRSCNTNTNKSATESKRRSRSRSNNRVGKFQENSDCYGEAEHQKHRNSSVDNYYYGNDELPNTKITSEGKINEKSVDHGLEKSTKQNYSKDERTNSNDRKLEKQAKYVKQKEKDCEKDKNEKGKSKDRQEVEEDKKDKKLKERKKKKKDKEDKETKKKIKKKEKKEKDKVKLKDSKHFTVGFNLPNILKIADDTLVENTKEIDNTQPENTELMEIEDDIQIDLNKDGVDLNLTNLYSDICQDEDIKYDYLKHNINQNNEEIDSEQKTCFEANKFDTNFDLNIGPEEFNSSDFGTKKTDSMLVPLPEPSKWENWEGDEDGQNETDGVESDGEDNNLNLIVDKSGKVTGEVLKRAENAIFKRAINAIRPSIEIKTISVDRQKLYSNENVNELPTIPVSTVNKKEENEQLSLKIILPIHSPTKDTSVETKSEKLGKNSIPTKSVKDRLGPILNKKSISTSIKKNTNSNHDAKTNQRRNKLDDRSNIRVNQRRSEIINQNRNNERERYGKNKSSRHDFQQANDFINRRQRYREQSRDHHSHLDLGPRKYDNYKYDKQRPKYPDKNIGGFKRRSNSRDNEKKEKNKDIQNKRQRSNSKSYENRDKRLKQTTDDNTSSRENKNIFESKKKHNMETNQTDIKDQASNREKKLIKKSENDSKIVDTIKIDTNDDMHAKQINKNSKIQTHHKNPNSTSGGITSSSSSSETDSGTESEGRKNSKRKHKKEKKRTKRFSSTESNNSIKKKTNKNKKRSKTSKKKKSKK